MRERAKRRVLILEKLRELRLEDIVVMFGVIGVVVAFVLAMTTLSIQTFKLEQQGRWLDEKIQSLRLEIENLREEIRGLIPQHESLKFDGE